MDKQVEFYVVLGDKNRGRSYMSPKPHAKRMTIGRPYLESGEVAVKVRLTISEEQFREFIPVVEASVEDRMIAAPEAEVLDPEPA